MPANKTTVRAENGMCPTASLIRSMYLLQAGPACIRVKARRQMPLWTVSSAVLRACAPGWADMARWLEQA